MICAISSHEWPIRYENSITRRCSSGSSASACPSHSRFSSSRCTSRATATSSNGIGRAALCLRSAFSARRYVIPTIQVETSESPRKSPAFNHTVHNLLGFLASRKPSNPIVLTGDIHNSFACDLHARNLDPTSPIVGAEFAGTSITSGRDGTDLSARYQAAMSDNPHVKFHNGQRGYVRCTVTRERWTTDYRIVPFVSRPGASIETRASLVVEDGRPGIHRA